MKDRSCQGWHDITRPGKPTPSNPGLSRLGNKVILPTLGNMQVLLIFGLTNSRFQSHGRYKSVEMNLYSHILISLNGNSMIVNKI